VIHFHRDIRVEPAKLDRFVEALLQIEQLRSRRDASPCARIARGMKGDAVNMLLDLVKASGIKMIESRRRALYTIADYCTTNKDITKYLEEEGDHSSRELIDAVLWCVGAVVMKARIV
jgi:hypothetical protein